MNMEIENFQGVPSLLKICTDTLPEYDNWSFARGYPTDISFPLGLKQLSGSPNNSINFFSVCRLSLDEGG